MAHTEFQEYACLVSHPVLPAREGGSSERRARNDHAVSRNSSGPAGSYPGATALELQEGSPPALWLPTRDGRTIALHLHYRRRERFRGAVAGAERDGDSDPFPASAQPLKSTRRKFADDPDTGQTRRAGHGLRPAGIGDTSVGADERSVDARFARYLIPLQVSWALDCSP